MAAALKGCEVMGLYELAKRGEVRLENSLILGLNCGGSMNETVAQKGREVERSRGQEGFSVPAVKEDSVNRFDQGKDAAYLKSV
ncbi:MAG: Coenzyme F420 hydrogenase/dehydrogenase, beta subunit C-terminal domain [Methanosarcina sp.]